MNIIDYMFLSGFLFIESLLEYSQFCCETYIGEVTMNHYDTVLDYTRFSIFKNNPNLQPSSMDL